MKYLNKFEIADAAEYVHNTFELNSDWRNAYRVANEYLAETYNSKPPKSLVSLVVKKARLIEESRRIETSYERGNRYDREFCKAHGYRISSYEGAK
ncbi:MAG: hypothetical protein Unbinned4512contig1001_6 [Prokaryotic dsDNA virus sp.]|nr:MAG: hypothetical protein Unbinned4512contig1001_6 [Prokaryotic dsDNA virus sp.]|tara:strand:+ start:96 stop:383 length:288 start_codon:yes stop_codon:yes gene_type:complete